MYNALSEFATLPHVYLTILHILLLNCVKPTIAKTLIGSVGLGRFAKLSVENFSLSRKAWLLNAHEILKDT